MAEPGQTVLRVVHRVDLVPTPADGQYIVEYDPTLRWDALGQDRTFKLVTSPDITKARGFPSVVEALEYWRQTCPNVPRANGRPNRPLTAFTCELTNA